MRRRERVEGRETAHTAFTEIEGIMPPVLSVSKGEFVNS